MTDIAVRLREYVENIRGHDEPPENYLCWQAADEIERLQTENKLLAGALGKLASKTSDEIERLRQRVADAEAGAHEQAEQK